MGATSATGVGNGSVEGKNAGSKGFTISGSRLIGPRTVAAGVGTLSGGTLVINLPLLKTAPFGYSVHVTDTSGTATAISAVLTSTTTNSVVTVTGTGTHTISYLVVKNGIAL